jgi:hypothetical protein
LGADETGGNGTDREAMFHHLFVFCLGKITT